MSGEVKAVCTNDEARDYFKNKGLTYDDVKEGDILVLTMLLNKHIKASKKTGETKMYLSKKVDYKKKTNGSMIACYLYVNSDYFNRRECISFNEDYFIGFAGWADQYNIKPILRAFLEWCDYLSGNWQQSIKTNADKIRAMSDEELAACIYEATEHSCYICPIQQDSCTVKNCKEEFLKWLKMPVEV